MKDVVYFGKYQHEAGEFRNQISRDMPCAKITKGSVKKSSLIHGFVAIINDECIAHIQISSLTEPIKSQVLELLKEQEEEK